MDKMTNYPNRDLEDTPPSPGVALNPNPWLVMEKNKGAVLRLCHTTARKTGRASTVC